MSKINFFDPDRPVENGTVYVRPAGWTLTESEARAVAAALVAGGFSSIALGAKTAEWLTGRDVGVVESDHEVQCPDCAAVIRARMADSTSRVVAAEHARMYEALEELTEAPVSAGGVLAVPMEALERARAVLASIGNELAENLTAERVAQDAGTLRKIAEFCDMAPYIQVPSDQLATLFRAAADEAEQIGPNWRMVEMARSLHFPTPDPGKVTGLVDHPGPLLAHPGDVPGPKGDVPAEAPPVTEMPGGHVRYVCPGGHDQSGCMFCDGGLTACARCGAFEGAWPDECPPEKLTFEQSGAIHAGRLNYREGQWHDGECCQVMLPVYHRAQYLAEQGFMPDDPDNMDGSWSQVTLERRAEINPYTGEML